MHFSIRALCGALLLFSAAGASAQVGSRSHPVTAEAATRASDTAAPTSIKVASLNEGFDNIGTLAAAGWFMQNSSVPVGLQPNWFQGTATGATPQPGPFNAFDGADNAYIAANFNFTSGANTISAWLLTPQLEFGEGATLSFYTRKPAPNPTDFPDRLEVRFSTNGASTNVGSGSSAVGDFTAVALAVNPTLVAGGYPLNWTQYTITNASGLPRNGSGRIAFRYYVTNGGPSGANSDYIGIDRVTYAGGTPAYQIGGAVTGLSGSGLTLQLNGGTPLPVSANGTFTFPGYTLTGSTYNVTVGTQPGLPSQTCSITNGSGTVSGTVSNIAVNCVTNNYAVGGSISGLDGSGLAISINNETPIGVGGNGPFSFSGRPSGSTYAITVVTQPTNLSQTCSVANGTGTVVSSDVTNVAITCVTNTYTVGANVSGLEGAGLVLQLDGQTLPIAANGTATFPTPLVDGTAFEVTVQTQPTALAQTCTVAGNGVLAGANAVVTVTCVVDTFTIGGTVSGLVGDRVELQLNGGATVSVTADGAFTIGSLPDGSEYTVLVSDDPALPAQTCSIANGTGTLAGANVTNIAVTCVTGAFTLAVESGSGQSANLGAEYANPLVVLLTDSAGAAVPDTDITFDAPDAGASVVLDDGTVTGDPITVATDVDGRAGVMATANTQAGCVAVTAATATATTVGFELTNVNPVPEVFEDGFESILPLAKGLGLCQP